MLYLHEPTVLYEINLYCLGIAVGAAKNQSKGHQHPFTKLLKTNWFNIIVFLLVHDEHQKTV